MPDFNVDPEQLRSHASDVDNSRDEAQTALDAANEVKTQAFDMAYGILCQQFPQALRPVEAVAFQALEGGVEALQAIGDGLRGSADNYQEVDEKNAAELQKISSMF